MARVLIAAVLAVLLAGAPAHAAPAERLGTFSRVPMSGPAVADGHVVWAASAADAVVSAAPPGRRGRVLARYEGPVDTPPDVYYNAVDVLAGGPRPALLRVVYGSDTSEYKGSGGFDAGWELLAGDPLRRLRGAVVGDSRPAATCPVRGAAADGVRIVLQVVARMTPQGACRHERAVDVLERRTGAATTVLRGRKASDLRIAGRYLAYLDRSVERRRMPIAVYDVVARREAYRTPPVAAGFAAMDVQADGKVVVVLAGGRRRGVAWYGPRQRRGRRLPVRAGEASTVRLVGDRALLQRSSGELAVVSLAGRVTALRGTRRVTGNLGFDGRWIAWAGLDGRRRGIFRARVERP